MKKQHLVNLYHRALLTRAKMTFTYSGILSSGTQILLNQVSNKVIRAYNKALVKNEHIDLDKDIHI